MIKILLKIVLASLLLTSATGTAKAVRLTTSYNTAAMPSKSFMATMCNALSWIAQMA